MKRSGWMMAINNFQKRNNNNGPIVAHQLTYGNDDHMRFATNASQ